MTKPVKPLIIHSALSSVVGGILLQLYYLLVGRSVEAAIWEGVLVFSVIAFSVMLILSYLFVSRKVRNRIYCKPYFCHEDL